MALTPREKRSSSSSAAPESARALGNGGFGQHGLHGLAVDHGLVGALVMLLGLAVFYLDSQPDLKVWHETALDEEFRAGGPVRSFADSLALENRLFAQLDRQVFARVPVQERSSINRFSEIEQILSEDPRQGIEALRGGESLPFTLSLLTSENEQVRRVPEFVKPAEPLH